MCEVPLSQPTMFQGLCLQITTGSSSWLFFNVYPQGSVRPDLHFYDDLCYVFELLVLVGPLVIGGFFNIPFEKAEDPDAVCLIPYSHHLAWSSR